MISKSISKSSAWKVLLIDLKTKFTTLIQNLEHGADKK